MAQISAYKVSASPHKTGKDTTRRLMLDVLIALAPCLAAGVVFYGLWALLLVVICMATCFASEQLCNLIRRKPFTFDLSALVTGLILGLNLPPRAPVVYPGHRRRVRDRHREDALRRAGQELCQPRRDGARVSAARVQRRDDELDRRGRIGELPRGGRHHFRHLSRRRRGGVCGQFPRRARLLGAGAAAPVRLYGRQHRGDVRARDRRAGSSISPCGGSSTGAFRSRTCSPRR